MAGKFGAICTEFPLTTFSTKKLNGFLLIFRPKLMRTSPCAKFLVTKTLKQPPVSVEDFFSPSNLSLNFFCTKWYTLYFHNEQQGKLFFLCTANWRVSNLNFLLKNDKYSLPCCYKKYIFQPYLFLCCYTVWFDANWSVFVKKELMCWSQNNLEPFSSLLVAKTQTIKEFLETNFFLHLSIPISKFLTLFFH